MSRYRPNSAPSERKHNILSNISICGATDIENVEEAARASMKSKKYHQPTSKHYSKCKEEDGITGIEFGDAPMQQEDRENVEKIEKIEKRIAENMGRCQVVVPPSMPQAPPIAEPVAPPIVGEEELTGLLLATNGWDECQLEMLDSILDSL